MLQHRSSSYLTDPLILQPEAGDQPIQCSSKHVTVGGFHVSAARAGKRDPVATNDHGSTRPLDALALLSACEAVCTCVRAVRARGTCVLARGRVCCSHA